MNESLSDLPIGVFDSGVGGLTVLHELQKKLPHESFLYLGDTARLPYGTKSPETIIRYATQAAAILVERGIKFLVVACITASSVSLSALQTNFPTIPVTGALESSARAACKQSKTGKIAVIATEATVNAKGYQRIIGQIRPDAEVIAKSCSLFVPLAEEGWTEGKIATEVAKKYLEPLLKNGPEKAIDCLVLGCTHFPTLSKTIAKVAGKKITIIDSAKTTAEVVTEMLVSNKLLRKNPSQSSPTFLVTDAPERFTRVAKQFLGSEVDNKQVELVDFVS